jgi:hypothetical protein
MAHHKTLAVVGFTVLATWLLFSRGGVLWGQDERVPGSQPWTLDEAVQQLRLYPRDAYLQYVALQLAQGENRTLEVSSLLQSLSAATRAGRGGRVEQVDLFSIFSGALAVQESLQLDTMLGEQSGEVSRATATPAGEQSGETAVPEGNSPAGKMVKVAELTGPTIKGHPWKEMLAGRTPAVSPLAGCVPADFYFMEFRSLGKALELGDTGDLWARHLFSQAKHEARSQLSVERLKRQLAIETTGLLRPFYDLVVQEIAVTGSDLFWREGSDVTVVFRVRQPEVFRAQMDAFLTKAEQSLPGTQRSEGEYLGVRYMHVASPDRAVHVFSAYAAPDLHVRSNSRVALRRVIEAIRGSDELGQPVTRLGDTDEFAYIRTLLPRGAEEEDGLIYLSDPFIRRLVGPQLKLTERRRMLCYNHLRMIGHAALLYRTQTGRAAETLQDLVQANCAPGEFGSGKLVCPDGGSYALSADGRSGVCSHHGQAACLTPCCEIPLTEVTHAEATAYRAFLEQYNQYWRTFFDPIAIRIQIAPERYRIETIVLPLIDNSIYTNLASAVGKHPEALDALPVPKRNIFSAAVRLDKEALVRQFGLEPLLKELESDQTPPQDDTASAVIALQQLGLAWHNYHDTFSSFPTAVSFDASGKKTRLSWRVHVLPFLGQAQLYDEFRLSEPWDSEHNRRLISRMPAVFRPANEKLVAAGRTKIALPLGTQTLAPNEPRKIGFRDIMDGTSNTIMLVEADDQHAVVWTQPEDLEIDLTDPQAKLAIRSAGGFLVAMCDGSVNMLRASLDANVLTALFTRAGGESVQLRPEDTIFLRVPSRRRDAFGLPARELRQLRAGEFLAKGIGNQIGLHICDADPLFAFSLPSFLGMSVGTFNGGRGFLGGDEGLLIGLLVSALNSPVYVSVPVQDAKVVDDFLTQLDSFLAVVARQTEPGRIPFFRIDQDFYQLQLAGTMARGYGFQVGPVKWRFFWARIGDGLYVASKPFILEDLAALETGDAAARNAANPDVAHALVRMRPQHWDRVLSGYRLGWAENNREACLRNLGSLSGLTRVLASADPGQAVERRHASLIAAGEQYFDSHFFCPDGGRYAWSDDGKCVTCTVHGSASEPRQPAAPSPASDLGRLLGDLSDLKLTLTFLEDGLHAVVTVSRK